MQNLHFLHVQNEAFLAMFVCSWKLERETNDHPSFFISSEARHSFSRTYSLRNYQTETVQPNLCSVYTKASLTVLYGPQVCKRRMQDFLCKAHVYQISAKRLPHLQGVQIKHMANFSREEANQVVSFGQYKKCEGQNDLPKVNSGHCR